MYNLKVKRVYKTGMIIIRANKKKIMGNIIKLSTENLKGLHFFINGMDFPVIAGSYSDLEKGDRFKLDLLTN